MKKKILMAAMTLLSVGMMTLTSCKDETSQSEKNISIRLEEVGYENSKMVIAGKDLHVEAHVLADAKIKSINIDLVDKVGKTVLSKEYKDEKYTYVLNTTFHEHIDIPANLPEGNYELRFTVTDVDNFSKNGKGNGESSHLRPQCSENRQLCGKRRCTHRKSRKQNNGDCRRDRAIASKRD